MHIRIGALFVCLGLLGACGQDSSQPEFDADSSVDISASTDDVDAVSGAPLDVESQPDGALDLNADVDGDLDDDVVDQDVAPTSSDADDDAVLEPPPEGEWCPQAWALLVDSLPAVVSGDTNGLSDNTEVLAACGEGIEPNTGADGVFYFVPDVSARYRFELTAPTTGPDRLAILSACDSSSVVCSGEADGDSAVLVDLVAGDGVFIVVDGSSTQQVGAFELVVDVVVDGDSCEAPIVVAADALPFNYVGDTTYAADDLNLGGGCDTGGNIGAGAPDVIFEFTPQYAGHYVMGLSPLSVIGDSPAVLYVLTECEAPAFSCVGVSANLAVGGLMSVYLEAGQPYKLVVDGLLAQDRGPYSFFIEDLVCIPQCPGPECGKDGCGGFCGLGCSDALVCSTAGVCVEPSEAEANQCEAATVVDSFPFATTRDTYYGSNDFFFGSGQCPGEPNPIGMTANDHIYAVTPSQTGLYYVQLSSEFDGALYIATDCSNPGASCVIGADSSLSFESLEIELEAEQTYFLVVDGYGNGEDDQGQYTLQIGAPCIASCEGRVCGSDGCSGSCGECPYGQACDPTGQCTASQLGDDCLNPFLVDAIPFIAEGSTADFQDDFSFAEGQCPGVEEGWGAASHDVVYRVEPTVADLYAISVEATFDSVVYVVTDCDAINTTCMGADDQNHTGEIAEVWMYPGTTYFIIVDGYGNQSNALGDYTLSITTACAPACKFKECGPDGCGGVCGECEGSLQCSEVGVCESLEGNGCDTPFLAEGPLPMTVSGDTSEAVNMLGVPYDACPDETAVRGPRSADQVWLFTPEVSGVYTLTLEAEFESVLYALTDCAGFGLDCFVEQDPGSPLVWFDVTYECEFFQYTPGTECVGIDSGVGIQGSSVTVIAPLVADTPYYLVVDGRSYAVNEAGPYTLSISEPCQPQCEGKMCGDDGCGLTCGVCDVDALCDAEQQCTTPEGNSCDQPFVVDSDEALPITLQGSTLDASNTYGMTYGECPLALEDEELRAGAGSRDQVYAFTPNVGGVYDLTIEADHQAVAYVLTEACESYLSTCYFQETKGHNTWTADTGECPFPEVCLGMASNTLEDGLISVELTANETVYIVVDGLGGLYDAAGAYTLTIDFACQPQCDGKSCGPDGCGETCGECGGGLLCTAEGQCVDEVEAQGNTCTNPWLVDVIPFLGVGMTSDKSAVYDPTGCMSAGEEQVGVRDEVWMFVPDQSAIYLVDVVGEGQFDPVFWIMEECVIGGDSCLKGSSSGTMDVSLEAGELYYLVVEGRQDSEEPELADQGTYTVEITLP